jgi:hypothetical protein
MNIPDPIEINRPDAVERIMRRVEARRSTADDILRRLQAAQDIQSAIQQMRDRIRENWGIDPIRMTFEDVLNSANQRIQDLADDEINRHA